MDIYFEKGFEIGIKRGMEMATEIGIAKALQEIVEQKNHQFVKSMLLADRFTSAEIANFVSVSEEYVEKVRSMPKS